MARDRHGGGGGGGGRRDRDRRDDRGHTHRNRSTSRDRDVRRFRPRSPPRRNLMRGQNRFHDRMDYGRLDRPSDRHDDRRQRSRERKRSRERSPVRERRRDDRDERRDDRDYRDDRDRKRAKRDDEPPRRARYDDRGDRRADRPSSARDNESPRPKSARGTEKDPEQEAADKLAKVEAWKRKMEEKKRAQAEGAAAAASPGAASADSPSQASTAPQSPAQAQDGTKSAPPAKYAGKFDPKEIAKRAAAKMAQQKAALGGDIVIPKSANATSNVNGAHVADNSKVAPPSRVNGAQKPTKADPKISGFGLSQAAPDKQDSANATKGAAPLEDEEEVERKLEKLPDMPTPTNTGDAALANDTDDQNDVEDIQSDEEEAEAAYEAALKRAEEVQAEQQDTDMVDAAEATAATVNPILPENTVMDDEEELDPLDAFMSGLEAPEESDAFAIGKGKKTRLQVFESDDEDRDAVGDQNDDFMAMAAKRKKKEVKKVKHEEVEYEPFRKEFYSESVELANMTPDEVDILRADLENIKCRGIDVPKPITKWSQGGFGAQILDVIRDQKYEKPTSIQSQALPAIMSGRDVIGVAKTGSGKTIAFILPMLRHVKDQRPVENMDGPVGLILAPTRELALQIHRDCKPYVKALNMRAVCCYGGPPIKDQIADLKRGAEIVVATPGRFIDLLAANNGRVTNLRRVTYLVLDEADRMFDMGFEPQVMKIINNIRPDRQTVLFSATFPKIMEAVARKALTRPVEIIVGGRSVVAPEITQQIEVRDEGSKFKRLLALLGEFHYKDTDERSLIFVERQETADNLLKDIMKKGYSCVSIHGGREQLDRDYAINEFRNGVYPTMIATSVAARGLDVKQLRLVINFDSPNHIEDYVHRCGRTGRAGNTGTAVTFVTPEQDRFASFLVKALKDSNQEIPEALQKLKEAHDEKVKAGDAKKIGSGFGGRGIERLDAARDAEKAAQRKQYKTEDDPEDADEEGEEASKKKKDANNTEVDKMLAKAKGAGVQDRDAAQAEDSAPTSLPAALSNHLSNAMKVQKAEPRPAAGSNSSAQTDKFALVQAAAAGINNRLGARGATRSGAPIDNRGPDAGAFHATLEINDFPQKARWAVSNRTNVAKVLDATGVSITNKGVFYEAGKVPGEGDQPKLYVLVEGDTEVAVENAMGELTEYLREGTLAALAAEGSGGGSKGRYNVV